MGWRYFIPFQYILAMNSDLMALAAGQHGVFSRDQAVVLGALPGQIERRLASGEWVEVDLRVYRHAASPLTWEGRLMAACLACEGVASHRGAARLHGVLDFPIVEVTTWRNRYFRKTPAQVHWLTDLDPDLDVTHIDGIPATNPCRTLIDLGAVCPVSRVEIALERALSRQLVTIPPLLERLDQLSRRGRSGVGRMRKVLAARGIGSRGADSNPEVRLVQILRRAGFPEPVKQYELEVGGRKVVIDLAYPPEKIALEYNGIDPHSGLRALEKDNAKSNLIVLAGWILVQYTKTRLRQPDTLCREIDEAFRLARSRGA